MKSCLVMRDCLTYSSPPFLYSSKATLFPWAHGCGPFLLSFKSSNDISRSPSLAQHRRLPPSFGGAVFFPSRGLQSWRALVALSVRGPVPTAGNVLAQSRRGGGGAWISRRETGERCRKEEGVNGTGGKRKVGVMRWMSSKTPFL